MTIWLIPLVLQPAIAFAMIVRKQVREFPLFLSYTLFVAGRDLGLLFLRKTPQLYSALYWAGEPITIIMGVAAIYEVLWHLIQPHPMLRLLGLRIFWGSLGIGLLTGLIMLKASPFSQSAISFESVLLLERSARFVQVAVLVVFIMFISSFGLTWKHHASGIVLGFGLSAGFQLALLELKSLQLLSNSMFSLLSPAIYDCAVMIWAGYFIPHRQSQPVIRRLPKTDLAKWNELLTAYLNR
jgi:hypothetical protein